MSLIRHAIILACLALAPAAATAQSPAPVDKRLTGDWDYYVMLGAAPSGGFEVRRRMGFVHFDGPYANGAWFKRRSGAPLSSTSSRTNVDAVAPVAFST